MRKKPAIIIFAILIVIFCLPLYVFYPKYHFSNFRKQIKKIYEESHNKSILGLHEYHIDEDGLTEKTEFNIGKHFWESFEKVVEFQDNLYFFIGSMQAYIIPKNAVV